jgi:uncharacterized protein (TIGR00295 family)
MNSIPSPDECLELLEKAGCSESVIRHCKAVRNVAVKMAKRAHADVELVEAGALLHDIGRSKTHDILHALEGVKIAQKLGLSQSIMNIIERHIGAGVSKTEAKKLGLPPKDYIPKTLEEKIVCHADNLIDKYERQNVEDAIEKALKEGHKEYAERMLKLHKELSDICGIDLNLL